MQWLEVSNQSRALSQPLRVKYCVSFFCRLRGLTFRRNLAWEEGLLLVQSRTSRLDAAIHMLAVGFDLAVVWLDAHGVVVDVQLARQWRLFYIPVRPARYVMEISAQRINHFKVGEKVVFEDLPLD